MEDRELLELAAKAAGIDIYWNDVAGAYLHNVPAGSRPGLTGLVAWKPLRDDGDALRLAFTLEMSVDMYGCIIGYSEDSQYEFENTTGDLANVRRAIVEVAAYLARVAV